MIYRIIDSQHICGILNTRFDNKKSSLYIQESFDPAIR